MYMDKNIPNGNKSSNIPESHPYSPTPPQFEKYNKASAVTKNTEPGPTNPISSRRKLLLRILAIAIPVSVVLYVIYWNFLPFGFSKTYTLTAGALTDTSGEIFFEPSPNLSERKAEVVADGKLYSFREIYDTAAIIFKPTAVLKNASITVSLEGDNVGIIPQTIDVDSPTITWDNVWDFSESIPEGFTGDPFIFDGCLLFDGKSILSLPGTEDRFENGPFSVYVEWTPQNDTGINQQIIGHYNWEIYQNKDSVAFRVGRMNDSSGDVYELKYPIKPDFFNQKHTLLAIYSPASDGGENGHIQMFIDGKFYGKKSIGSNVIWAKYGNTPLSLGWSSHNFEANAYYSGCIHHIRLTESNIVPASGIETKIEWLDASTKIFISPTAATGTIRKIKINALEN